MGPQHRSGGQKVHRSWRTAGRYRGEAAKSINPFFQLDVLLGIGRST